MPTAVNRHPLHTYLSAEAHAAWQLFADENGVSVTAVIERLGLDLAEELAAAEPDAVRGELVRGARRIDAARRRRTSE